MLIVSSLDFKTLYAYIREHKFYMHVQTIVTECKTVGLEAGQMLFMNAAFLNTPKVKNFNQKKTNIISKQVALF